MKAPSTDCEILIPEFRDSCVSDGRAQSEVAWQWFRSVLTRITGYTEEVPNAKRGACSNPVSGRSEIDRHRSFVVSLKRRDYARLRAALGVACHVFGQREICLNVAGKPRFVKRLDERQFLRLWVIHHAPKHLGTLKIVRNNVERLSPVWGWEEEVQEAIRREVRLCGVPLDSEVHFKKTGSHSKWALVHSEEEVWRQIGALLLTN